MSETRQERLAQALSRTLADENTPFIRNAWYVAARSDDIAAGALLQRKIMSERIVFYRDPAGQPIALRDACPHRGFPLSQGRLDGDGIVCGYHGFRYGPDGACSHVPTQAVTPGGLRTRSFPLLEQRPLVWIWMGDPALADPAKLPAQDWMAEAAGWSCSLGYLRVNASYVNLHENLLDLSHLTFLHAKTFGTPDYAAAPFDVDIDGGHIVLHRTVAPTFLPPIYARPLDMQGKRAARIVTSTFVSPALSISAVVLQNLELPEGERPDHHIQTAQLLTPESPTSLHYHFLVARDFARNDTEVTDFIHSSIQAAFAEDVYALEEIEKLRRDQGYALPEHSVGSDRAGVAMRRHLRELAEAEALSVAAQ